MYWYMMTTTSSGQLLPDDVWTQIPRTSADRRVVGGALLVVVLLLAAIIIGKATGVLTPRLTYEGGSSTAPDARTHSLIVRAIIHNASSRSWKITGATVNAPGTLHEVQTTPVSIAAHHSRTVMAVVHIDNCAAIPRAPNNQHDVSYNVNLRVERLLGASTVTIDSIFDDQLVAVACGP
jgi:hypothetical protein